MTDTIEFLLRHFWESTVFAIACCTLILVQGKGWSFSRHFLAWATMFKFLVPFSLIQSSYAYIVSYYKSGQAINPNNVGYIEEIGNQLRIDTWISFKTANTSTENLFPWSTLILFVWSLGILTLTYLWIRQHNRISAAIKKDCVDAEKPWVKHAQEIWTKPTQRMPEIMVCKDGCLLAGLFGLTNPVIIIPSSFCEGLNKTEREAFLRHEFQHAYKHDNLWLFTQKLIRNLFWIHPLVWWLDRQISAEREIMRDEEVIRKTNNTTSYLNCLMKASKIQLPGNYATSVGITGSPFVRRIKAIGRIKQSRAWDFMSAAFSITSVFAITAFLSATLPLSSVYANDSAPTDDYGSIEELEEQIVEWQQKIELLSQELEPFAMDHDDDIENASAEKRAEIDEIKQKIRIAHEQHEATIATLESKRIELRESQLKKFNELEDAIADNSFDSEEDMLVAVSEYEQLEKVLKKAPTIVTREPKPDKAEIALIKEVLNTIKSKGNEAGLEKLKAKMSSDYSAALPFIVGNLEFELGNIENAISSYEEAIAIMPDFIRAIKNLAIIQIQADRFDDAKVNFLKLVGEYDLSDTTTLGLLGLSYLKSNDAISAEHYYRRALKADSEVHDWYLGLAKSLYQQGKNSEADEVILEAEEHSTIEN